MPPKRNLGSQQLETMSFLYTQKLNENATKNLKKAQTNKEERQVLSKIFGLLQGQTPPQNVK